MAHIIIICFCGRLAYVGLEAVFWHIVIKVEHTAWNEIKHFRFVGSSTYAESYKQFPAAIFSEIAVSKGNCFDKSTLPLPSHDERYLHSTKYSTSS